MNVNFFSHRSKIIDEFSLRADGKPHALAYFYCNYREEVRRDPAYVLRALVKQLCLVDSGEGLPEPVLSVYQEREKNGHQLGALHLKESKDLIVELSKGFVQTTIVIDALDECDFEKRKDLFLMLKDIITLTQHVRIFLTSRNDGDIQKMLYNSPSHYIDATDNTGDIKMYIRSEIDRCYSEGLLPSEENDPTLKSEIILTLEKGAKGMYVFALSCLMNIQHEFLLKFT